MKNPEILRSLNSCGTAIETALRTTIHLINDNIFTDYEMAEDVEEQNPMAELSFDNQ